MLSPTLRAAAAVLLFAGAAAPGQAVASGLGDKLAEHLCGGPAHQPFNLSDAEATEFSGATFTGMFADYGRSLRFFDRVTETTGNCFERTEDRFGNPVCRDAAAQRAGTVITRENWIQQPRCPSQQ
ncbi:hypothetical protein STVA_37140 [Allostella vacuolata]|nr:hypothetical protein STVA_37140 [Stella vacuolata]